MWKIPLTVDHVVVLEAGLSLVAEAVVAALRTGTAGGSGLCPGYVGQDDG